MGKHVRLRWFILGMTMGGILLYVAAAGLGITLGALLAAAPYLVLLAFIAGLTWVFYKALAWHF